MRNRFYTVYKEGFTLMELMAVVAILSILAAIGLGTYRRANEKAILFQGLRNAHALAAAMDAYAAEHGGYQFAQEGEEQPIPDEVFGLLSEVEDTSNTSRNVRQTRNFIYTIYVQPESTTSENPGNGFTFDEEGEQVASDGSGNEKMSVHAMRRNEQYGLIVPLEQYAGQETEQDICWVNPASSKSKEGYELCRSAGFTYCDSSNRCKKYQ